MENRKKAFTEFEKKLLLNLIEQHAHIVENKKIDNATTQHKKAAWLQITQEFNACTRIECAVNPKQLKKYWSNIKTRAKEKSATQENQRHFTEVPAIKVRGNDIILNETDDDDGNFWVNHKSLDEEEKDDPIEEKVSIQYVTEHTVTSTPPPLVDVKPESYMCNSPTLTPPPVNHRRKVQGPSIDSFKKKMMEQDFLQRKKRFVLEMKHLKKIHDMEITHKETMFQLHKEEMQLKIEILKKELGSEKRYTNVE